MFSLFNFKRKINPPVRNLTDMHAHLLPGIDDGAKSIAESIQMIKQMHLMGYTNITATPHVFSDYYPNTKENILRGAEDLKAEIEKSNIPISLHVAAEYFLDAHFKELLDDKSLLTLFGNAVLVEMSTIRSSPLVDDLIWEIKSKGYCPVLAHPERYLYLTDEDYGRFISYGCKFQINLLSLSGNYGRQVKKRVYKILKNNWATIVGTDLHKPTQLNAIKSVIQSPFFSRLPDNNLIQRT